MSGALPAEYSVVNLSKYLTPGRIVLQCDACADFCFNSITIV